MMMPGCSGNSPFTHLKQFEAHHASRRWLDSQFTCNWTYV